MRAQVSIEYLIILGFAFLLIAPVIILFYTQSTELNADVTARQAQKVVSEIVESADRVYFFGAPTQRTITLQFPKNVESVVCQGKSVIMTIRTNAGPSEIVAWSAANITGINGPNPCLKNYPGPHNIVIQAYEDPINSVTIVKIGD